MCYNLQSVKQLLRNGLRNPSISFKGISISIHACVKCTACFNVENWRIWAGCYSSKFYVVVRFIFQTPTVQIFRAVKPSNHILYTSTLF